MQNRKKSKIEQFEDEAKMIIARNITSLVDQNSLPSKMAKKIEIPNVLDPNFEEKMGLTRPSKKESKLPQIRKGSNRNSPFYKERVEPLKEI